MTTTEKTSGIVEISTDHDHILHRKGTDGYSRIRIATVPATDFNNWEEVALADIPPYTESQYEAKVEELIRTRYSISQEFALINNVMANVTEKRQNEYAAYQDYRDQCKRRAREILIEMSQTVHEDTAG